MGQLTSNILSAKQLEVFRSRQRFRVLACGRRWGKTFEDIEECLKFATLDLARMYGPNFRGNTGYDQNVWYVAPTYRMAQDIAWNFLIKRLEDEKIRYKPNETKLTAKLLDWGSEISLKGADNYDSLRGRGLNFVVLDEVADIEKEAWTEVIRPALSDKHGHALFTGTPKGFNHFYELFCKGVDKDPGWRSWQQTTLDGGWVPQEEIDAAMADLDIRTFRQEYMATFETYAGVVYYNFSRKSAPEGSVVDTQPFTMPDIHIGMDFNVNPMTAIVGEIRKDRGSAIADLYWLDEILIYGSNTYEMCQEIKDRYPDKRIYVYPDPACNQHKTSAAGGVTDLSILEGAGFQVRVRPTHPLIRDRVNAVNAKLMNAKGERHMFVAKKCKNAIKCLERQVYKDDTSIPDKKKGFDHGNDAIGYPTEFLFPIVPYKTTILEV